MIPLSVSVVTAVASSIALTGATQTFMTPSTGARNARWRPSWLTVGIPLSELPYKTLLGINAVPESCFKSEASSDKCIRIPQGTTLLGSLGELLRIRTSLYQLCQCRPAVIPAKAGIQEWKGACTEAAKLLGIGPIAKLGLTGITMIDKVYLTSQWTKLNERGYLGSGGPPAEVWRAERR